MFSGEETKFSVVMSHAIALELCVHAILGVWPSAIVQNAANAEIYSDYRSIPFAPLKEIMIYRDEKALRSWDELGADEMNRNTMAHLVFMGDSLSLVLDDTTSKESISVLNAVRTSLELNGGHLSQKEYGIAA